VFHIPSNIRFLKYLGYFAAKENKLTCKRGRWSGQVKCLPDYMQTTAITKATTAVTDATTAISETTASIPDEIHSQGLGA